MAHIKTYSVPDNEVPIFEEFKQLCKDTRTSMSEEIVTFMAKAVQANKEGKTLHYSEPKLWKGRNNG